MAKYDVRGCSSCGKDHKETELELTHKPVAIDSHDFHFRGKCPETGEYIYAMFHGDEPEKESTEPTIRLVHRGPNQPEMTMFDLTDEVRRLESELYESEHEKNKLMGEIETLEKLREVTVNNFNLLRVEYDTLEAENRRQKAALDGIKIDLEGAVCECGHKLKETDAYDRVIAALVKEGTLINTSGTARFGVCNTAVGGSNPVGICVEDVKKGDPALFDLKTGELRSDWEAMADKWKELAERRECELKELREATGGHSIENLKALVDVIPSVEDLQEKRLSMVFTTWQSGTPDFMVHLAVIPTDEYIENDDISDDMVTDAGGRVPCEVRSDEANDWSQDMTLVSVSKNEYPFTTMKDGVRGVWPYCRIKKMDLDCG